jgi:hypothetical protein
MLKLRHLACLMPMLIRNCFILKLFSHGIEMEDIVEAVSARLNLQRVRENDEDGDGKLSDGDKKGGRGVHCDDVRAHLDGILNERVKLIIRRTYVRTESEIAKYGDDFVGESCGANGRSNGDVHTFLRVRLELIEDGK